MRKEIINMSVEVDVDDDDFKVSDEGRKVLRSIRRFCKNEEDIVELVKKIDRELYILYYVKYNIKKRRIRNRLYEMLNS